jgi:hypothetical protein
VKPTRSAKSTVTTFRSSRTGAAAGSSGVLQLLQNRAPAGFSWPQLGQVVTREGYAERRNDQDTPRDQ